MASPQLICYFSLLDRWRVPTKSLELRYIIPTTPATVDTEGKNHTRASDKHYNTFEKQ